MARWSPIERDLRERFGPLLVGMDEVGRGPLAGPVVACAVVMPPGRRAIAGVDDSKRLDAAVRDALAEKIRATALAIGLGAASPREIDRLNIYHATVLAMQRALRRVDVRLSQMHGERAHHLVVDGKPLRTLGAPHTAVVKGDGRCYAIACASIVAKVTRDRLMRQLAVRYDRYDWSNNVGYGTARHRRGLAVNGLTPHHRRSFLGSAQLSLLLAHHLSDDTSDVPPDTDAHVHVDSRVHTVDHADIGTGLAPDLSR